MSMLRHSPFLNTSVARQIPLMLLITGNCLLAFSADLNAGERLVLEVREVGGFARHEPVSKLLTLPQPVPRGTPFRLEINGGGVAQFRPASDDEPTARWWVDFSTILSPYELREYVVEYGGDVQPVAESVHGHVLRQTREAFVVENSPYITWTIPRDLRGLLKSVNFPPSEHLRADSPGLVLRDKAGGRHLLGGAGVTARVVRSGTRAIALQFTGGFDQGPLAGVRWTTDLILPSPVSWLEVICRVDDREGKVTGLGTELNMALETPKAEAPTLVDLGAWTQVYTSLTRDEMVEMRAAPGSATSLADGRAKHGLGVHGAGGRCLLLRGRPEQLEPLATNYVYTPDAATARPLTAAPEGWLHVMDRKRCLALAVDQFAQDASERLTVSADGGVRVWREYATGAAQEKTLHCWLHFVHYPPQFSAGTSPRMMQTRPTVRIKPR